ncbi:ER membrane protein complex subunit 4-like isoform X2 [Xenia sp. Carnegie-2017]|uniref:ER membrane protein complex subunit 4-like isoform X2 n=1 Tax=Xenia sp. Carnegie-2017 TaxID=2897299 RepID=UPI001F03F972|nr:ER membrane protein complex subunit 4-like isoform X2 [Xenia sp. Carnegie-2017]
MAARNVVGKGKNNLKWSLDLTLKPKHMAIERSHQNTDLAAPAGFTNKQLTNTDAHEIDTNLVTKKSWDIAIGPLKQIPMTLFIMYMAGNTISLFPIMMVGMMFLKPVKALISISSAFVTLEGDQSFLMKIIYLLGNIALLLLALYKCQSMGLLPTSPSDWIEFVEHKERLEYSGGGMTLA